MLLRKMWAVECSVDLAAFSQMPRSAAVPLLKRVWIAERPICSIHPPPSLQCLRALRQTVGIKTATKAPMWNHTKSSIIIRHTLSKLWTSRLISCHYSQIGWSSVCHWPAFLVAGLVQPIGVWAQVYILGWVIYKETTDQTIVALPLPDRTRAIHICPFVSSYLSAISSYISCVLWTGDCKYERVVFSPVVRMLLSFITTIITTLT